LGNSTDARDSSWRIEKRLGPLPLPEQFRYRRAAMAAENKNEGVDSPGRNGRNSFRAESTFVQRKKDARSSLPDFSGRIIGVEKEILLNEFDSRRTGGNAD
jgi:hypothetical protein